MDQFERLVCVLLEHGGYWVRQSQRVPLDASAKRELQTPNMPNPELDVVAFQPRDNELLVLEVKSYFDSRSGVTLKDINGTNSGMAEQYRLLHNSQFRDKVEAALIKDLEHHRLLPGTPPKVKYGFVLGRVSEKQSDAISQYLENRDWQYWGPTEIKKKLTSLASTPYRNDPVVMTVKALLR